MENAGPVGPRIQIISSRSKHALETPVLHVGLRCDRGLHRDGNTGNHTCTDCQLFVALCLIHMNNSERPHLYATILKVA